MSERESHYVHGTSAAEQRRLSRLNELLNETSLPALELCAGERVLDVGSGLGQLSRAMARAVGRGGRVLAIERSAEQIDEANRQARDAREDGSVEFRRGDALALPLADGEWGTFDVAHTRFLLEHVPRPLEVVRQMVRAVRPGGRIVLEDDDHDVFRIWPEPEAFTQVWGAYCASYQARGNDPYVGRKLVRLLDEAGAAPRRNRCISFACCSGDADMGSYVDNVITILEVARDDIVATGRATDAQVEQALASVAALRGRPDAALWFARSWAMGVRER